MLQHWESGAVSNRRKTHIRFQIAVNISQIKLHRLLNISFSTLSRTACLPFTCRNLTAARRWARW